MNNVRKVQMTQMEILRLFMDICERHRLRWYMIGGSLIGVLRHKGFIPWDDDIDIGMPRKDYDKFVSLQAEYPDGYGLTCHGNTPEWQFNFSQFIDRHHLAAHPHSHPCGGNGAHKYGARRVST